jgi:3-hydroxyisobutyrate dehydrogenase-like beta-hydroxyacid dehydrogenase
MGQAFAKNLLDAGFEVQGFDPDERRMDELRGRGGHPVGSPAAAARGVAKLITSLPNSAIMREATLGSDGIIEGAEKGLIIADTTTGPPEDAESLAQDLASRGIRLLDASVSGTSAMAMKKDVVLVVGGRMEEFETCRTMFASFSKGAYYLGPTGSGARAKLIINLVLLCNRLALAEGLVLGMKSGMDLEMLLTVLKEGAAGSKVMDQKGEKMIKGDYLPESYLTSSMKDVGIILSQGQKLGTPMFMTSMYAQIVRIGVEAGYGELDPACIIEIVREMAGLPRRVP